MCMIAPIVSKKTLLEQKQDSLKSSVSVVAPEMQYRDTTAKRLSIVVWQREGKKKRKEKKIVRMKGIIMNMFVL